MTRRGRLAVKAKGPSGSPDGPLHFWGRVRAVTRMRKDLLDQETQELDFPWRMVASEDQIMENQSLHRRTVAKLEAHGYVVASERRLPDGKGYQVKLESGQIVNVYDSGRVVVQGKNREPVEEILASERNSQASPPIRGPAKGVRGLRSRRNGA